MSLSHRTRLKEAFAALRNDLIHAEGPQISTMRNYRFAILQYEPSLEFELRRLTQRLSNELVANGWMILPIDLQKVLLKRVREQGERWVEKVVAMEHRLAKIEPERGLTYLNNKLSQFIEGPEGIAKDCGEIIREYARTHPPEQVERTLALIGRAGALYPFFRSSALLKHLDGKTEHVPVVLLYPGERRGETGLSFMGQLEPDHDYRPRIYS